MFDGMMIIQNQRWYKPSRFICKKLEKCYGSTEYKLLRLRGGELVSPEGVIFGLCAAKGGVLRVHHL